MTEQTVEDITTEDISDEPIKADVEYAGVKMAGPWYPPSRLTVEQMGTLMSDIHPARVASRTQGGVTLSYVKAYEIKAMLIRIFGFGGFSAEVTESRILDIRDDGRQGTYLTGEKAGKPKTPYVLAYAKVRLTIFNIGPDGQDAVYEEAAIGSNDGFIIGEVADNALKSAASDALKRCAIYLGTQFGLSLYKKGSRQEVVRRIFAPHQRDLWQEAVGTPQPPDTQETAGHIERALGGQVTHNDEGKQEEFAQENRERADS